MPDMDVQVNQMKMSRSISVPIQNNEYDKYKLLMVVLDLEFPISCSFWDALNSFAARIDVLCAVSFKCQVHKSEWCGGENYKANYCAKITKKKYDSVTNMRLYRLFVTNFAHYDVYRHNGSNCFKWLVLK